MTSPTQSRSFDVDGPLAGGPSLNWPPAKPSSSVIHAARSPWQFEPVGRQMDLTGVTGLHRAWSVFVSSLYDQNINGRAHAGEPPFAIQELRQWGATEADLRFYSPTRSDITDGASPVEVTWPALPSRYDRQFGGSPSRLMAYLDAPQNDPQVAHPTRMHDEFCEWMVQRDGDGKIRRIVFTTEPPEFFEFLLDPPAGVDPHESRALLVQLYRERAGSTDIRYADLLNSDGTFNRWNRWNNAACVHLQQPNNSLAALINLAARASIVRQCAGRIGCLDDLVGCAGCGDATRRSDPAIGLAINGLAAQNRFVTLANPVGVHIAGIDTAGWTTPDGADPGGFWRVLRGLDTGVPAHNTIVRAELCVPADRGYTVSDIAIDGQPIVNGGQVAARITLRLGLLAGPVSMRPAPHAIGCLPSGPTSIALPVVSQAPGRRI